MSECRVPIDAWLESWTLALETTTPRIGFLEDAEELLGLMKRVERLQTASFETDRLCADGGTLVVVPAAP